MSRCMSPYIPTKEEKQATEREIVRRGVLQSSAIDESSM